jgi:hypothetical protein
VVDGADDDVRVVVTVLGGQLRSAHKKEPWCHGQLHWQNCTRADAAFLTRLYRNVGNRHNIKASRSDWEAAWSV